MLPQSNHGGAFPPEDDDSETYNIIAYKQSRAKTQMTLMASGPYNTSAKRQLSGQNNFDPCLTKSGQIVL